MDLKIFNHTNAEKGKEKESSVLGGGDSIAEDEVDVIGENNLV